MRGRFVVMGAAACLAIATSQAAAQRFDDDSDAIDPTWNIHAQGGTQSHGRFLLQNTTQGQRALQTDFGWSVGGGFGADFLKHTGVRLGYSYGTSDLQFRTDDGNGSESLDVNDQGELDTHTASIELIRYMLNVRSTVTPYASAGFLGTWWMLDSLSTSTMIQGAGETHFRWGGIASLGVKVRPGEHFDLRAEWATSTIRNPFSGRDAYRLTGGTTVDEPTRVSRTNLRLFATVNFGSDHDRRHARRGRD